jgi:type VI secretion system protein ImpK
MPETRNSRGMLALVFQEPITAIVRLRAGRQTASDSAAFRRQMRDALEAAARQARDLGACTAADIRSATFAVVAFLDESILNSRLPTFADWVRKPLQEELFGTHVAGVVFFENVRDLVAQPDSAALADVLEIYTLCLLLGFTGRHTGGRRGELNGIVTTLRDRIRRIRGHSGDLSPAWKPPSGASAPARDRLFRPLALIAVTCLILSGLLFFGYSTALSEIISGVSR